MHAPKRAIDPESWMPVRYIAFSKPSMTGEFTDFTARYGALQEEDKETVRQRLDTMFGPSEAAQKNVSSALSAMKMEHLIDMPYIALSSGQTRRSRLAQGIMTRPEIMLLEDPLAGVDAATRVVVSKCLGELNATEGEPRVVLVVRDFGPEKTLGSFPWVTNVVEVREGNVWIGTREQWEVRRKQREDSEQHADLKSEGSRATSSQPPIVQLRDVSVTYGEGTRPVLKNVNWDIVPGDRWHLQGANGELT